MNSITWIAVLFSFTASLYSQDFPSPAHQQTSSIPGARFEIVQSPLAAKWSFRLDRHSGHIWQLVSTAEGGNDWNEMLVIDLPPLKPPTHPRFQIFTSGLAARHTFLLDTESGKTWVIVSSKGNNPDGTPYETAVWRPFAAHWNPFESK